jgi:hypothetical protein
MRSGKKKKEVRHHRKGYHASKGKENSPNQDARNDFNPDRSLEKEKEIMSLKMN